MNEERRPADPVERAYLRVRGCTCEEPEVLQTPHDLTIVFPDGIPPVDGTPLSPVVYDVEFFHAPTCRLLLLGASPWN